jgi:hypothetical protein
VSSMGNMSNVWIDSSSLLSCRLTSALSDHVWDNRVNMSRRHSVGLEMLENLTELGRGMPAQLSTRVVSSSCPTRGVLLPLGVLGRELHDFPSRNHVVVLMQRLVGGERESTMAQNSFGVFTIQF